VKKHNDVDWLRLDNAAKIYPASASGRSPAQFRVSVTFNTPIKYKIIKNAWQNLLPRCPYFQVHLCRGFFWYFLQKHEDIPDIELMGSPSNSLILHKRKLSHLIRISIAGCSLALDFSHILTDGNGAMRFLIALISEYARLNGISSQKIPGLPYVDEDPAQEEFEDGYKKFFPGKVTEPEILSKSFHIPGKPMAKYRSRIISGKISLKRLKQESKQYKVSVTELLAAFYLFSLQELHQQDLVKKKPGDSIIRLEIPVNMRKIYPSNTMRNFSLFISVEIDLKLGDYSFAELIRTVHLQMQMKINSKELSRQVSRNVSGELNPFIRIVPLFMKDLYLSRTYSNLGEKCYSGVLSNLGPISLPSELQSSVNSFNVILIPNHVMKNGVTVFTYGDKLQINFSSVVENRELERLFFTKLVGEGIPVRVSEVL